MTPRNILRIVLIAIVAGSLLYKHFASQPPSGKPAASRTAPVAAVIAASAAAVKPSPPRHWQLGKLNLTSCELPQPNSGATTAAWCTEFDVPENPAQPAGRHITLHLAVIRSDADRPAADVVVMLAGGPGEAATEAFSTTSAYAAGVLKHHHVLLVDQRGTGHSNPLSCAKAAKAQEAQPQPNDLPTAEEIRGRVATCLTEVQTQADPRFYTTTIAVDDLERVRQALGSPPFDVVGGSYGTRVAQQYVMRHPEGVRSVVLDSPVPNRVILGAGFASNLDAALKLDFADCIASPACKKAYGDPMETLHKLRDDMTAHPREVTFRDPRTFKTVTRKLTPGQLVLVVRLFAYAPETASLLPLSIDAAAHGDFTPLLGQEQLLSADLAGDMNGGMSMSVICSEDADQLQQQPEDAGTLLGNRLVDAIKAQCEAWPHGTRPDDFHAAVHNSKPTLILSGTRDPVTPPQYGKEILAGLSNARQLIFNGLGHGEMSRGCMPKLLEQFIDDPDPKKLDASCLDRLGPTPAFVDFNGAAP